MTFRACKEKKHTECVEVAHRVFVTDTTFIVEAGEGEHPVHCGCPCHKEEE